MPEPLQQIRTAHACAADSREAVREFHAQLKGPDTALVVFFCSADHDTAALAAEMNRLFQGVPVVGCTTAGSEIGPAGYRERSLSGAAFPRAGWTAVAGLLPALTTFELARAQRFAQGLLRDLETAGPGGGDLHEFALLLVDGLSKREELITYALQTTLGEIPLLGGSAGDSLRFRRTLVFHGGAFHSDAAVLILVRTRFPFRIFKTQHFAVREERLVVTASDAPNRVVSELNGMPAAEEYARLIGAEVSALTPEHFAAAPAVVLIDGNEYVRSIQRANPDRSLTFYGAIERGVVLRIARALDLEQDLRALFGNLSRELGPPQAVIAFDCVLRQLELSRGGRREAVGDLLRRHHTVGFSTYGEQYGGVHVNQTFTGIAIGGAAAGAP